MLEDFLYHAIYLPPNAESVPYETIYIPEIYVYVKDFGTQRGDVGCVAEVDNEIVGAAWTRIILGYGHLDSDTPELAISVLPNYRNLGIGTELMTMLFKQLREKGFKQTSLSVQKDNPAVRFYQKLGYEITGERVDCADHEDYLMLYELL